jgi:GNAT superfamily N-acetyltransferase
MTTPFVIFGLPRSRTYWLSRLLNYGPYWCAHDQARFVRSVDDVKSWLAQSYVGSVETAAAPWWRLARHYRPDLRMAVVRRDRRTVADSLMRFGVFDRAKLDKLLTRADRALDSAAKAPGCLSVDFAALNEEATCARLFEHCLGLAHDRAWWASLAAQNLQTNLLAICRYVQAHAPQMQRAAKECAGVQRYVCLKRQAAAAAADDGVAIQEESYAAYWRDAQALMAEHSAAIGLDAGAYSRMNVPLWEAVARSGRVQIMTARLNGRMIGYLTAILGPSFEEPGVLTITQMAFYASPDAKGLRVGQRLQRAAIDRARMRGATKMYMRAGVRGDGPRLGALYRRMGAGDFGQLYELDLTA